MTTTKEQNWVPGDFIPGLAMQPYSRMIEFIDVSQYGDECWCEDTMYWFPSEGDTWWSNDLCDWVTFELGPWSWLQPAAQS